MYSNTSNYKNGIYKQSTENVYNKSEVDEKIDAEVDAKVDKYVLENGLKCKLNSDNIIDDNIIEGYLLTKTGGQSARSGWYIYYGNVSKGDRLYFSMNDGLGASYALWCVKDSNGNVLHITPGGQKLLDKFVTIPDDGVLYYSTNGTRNFIYRVTTEEVYRKSEVYKKSEVYTKGEVDALIGNGSHTVLWLGTSIPAGCPYPQNACATLGWTCHNKALGSSGMVLNSGYLGNGRDGKDLCESAAEKEARYREYVTSGTITEATLTTWKTYGYDSLIIPYIDGTVASCDMIIFEHGYNDRQQIQTELNGLSSADFSTDLADSSFDRTTYVGAFCFLIKKIWEVNPNIKICICSYLERISGPYLAQGGHYGQAIYTMHKAICDHFAFPFLDMCDFNGFNYERIPDSSNYLTEFNSQYGTNYTLIRYYGYTGDNITKFQYYCLDGIHPHTDRTGRAEAVLTASAIKCLSGL